MDYESLTVSVLKRLCKAKGIRGCSQFKKAELIDIILKVEEKQLIVENLTPEIVIDKTSQEVQVKKQMTDFDRNELAETSDVFDAFTEFEFGGDRYKFKGLQEMTVEYDFIDVDKYDTNGVLKLVRCKFQVI